ncbi:hypothetical protein Tco_0188792 [Tanacetum coccineum]
MTADLELSDLYLKKILNSNSGGQCIDELKDNVFLGNDDENPLEHISNMTSVSNLFQSPRVSSDQVMLMAFPFTLKEKARLWINRLSAGSITTWDLLKNAFLSRYRPLSQIIRQTKAIRNFGQECNEPLHLAWERFNDLLYNCPEHKINEHEQLQIFYQGLDPETRKKADFMGPIPRMTPTAGIKAINELSKHSLSWYKEEEYKEKDFDKVLRHINDFEHNISVLNEEVRMVQHQYKTPNDERDSLLEETISSFVKKAHWMQKKSENFVWRIKRNYDRTFKNQASAIKTIEKNLGRIAESIHGRGVGALPSFTETNPRGLAHAITTRSGLNYQPPKNPLEDSDGLHNITTKQIPTTEKITPEQTHNSTQKTDPPIPFPSRLKKEKENEQFQKFLRNLQQIHINIPFIEALEQMPKYAKFMKDLLSKKGKGSETSKIILNEQCSAVILNKVPHKEKDPGGFTIPCVIGQSGITKALADLGASISLMPYSMFLRLNLGDLKPTRMCIELANKTTQFPKGIAENVMVKIDKFVFLVDFVILDMEEDHRIPIILGRPFLATAHAMIDVFNKKISFEVGDEIITFDLEKSMKFPPSNEDTCHAADIVDLSVVSNMKEILPQDHDNSIEPILYQLPEIHEDDDNPALFTTNSIDDENPTLELPSHLKYAFLDNNRELPVIISSLLSDQEKRSLLKVLTKHKKALAWKISDIKGISPSFCTHKILMEENSKPTVQPQRRLNPKVQDVVETELLKLLDA